MNPLITFRTDIQWRLHGERWVARDPINGRYFYLSSLEYAAVRLLDGKHTLAEINQLMRQQYPHACIDSTWLARLLQRLNVSQLLVAHSLDAIHRLALKQQRRQSTWKQWLLSPLAIRIPLINPEPALRLCKPLARLLFARSTVMAIIVLGAIANLSALSHWLVSPHSLTWDLSLLQGDRWLWLIASYVLVKSLHELGHGLACVYWGTRCSELGLLFLFFTPCLYCDTTDAWKLSSRWQRAAICAAGMYVELIIASVAAVVWLITQDGLLHALAANVMVICSLGTLLINGNPLLRYDGYYILSDIWGVPNLADQSREAMLIFAKRLMGGQRVDANHLDGPIWMLTTYHLIAFAYRTFIMFAILWLAWTLLVPMGLGFLAILILSGMVLGLMFAMVRFVRELRIHVLTGEAIKYSRIVALLGGLLWAVYFFCQVELPVYVRARAVTDFADKLPVFSTDNATVLRAAALGREVQAGDILLQLDSPEKRYELQLNQNEIALLKKKVEYLNRATGVDPSTSFELPITQQLLNDRLERSRLLEQELAMLNQVAPAHGRILPSEISTSRPLAGPIHVPWQAGPLEAMSIGGQVQRGTLLGWFSQQQAMEVIAVVSQREINALRLGMKAVCQWDSAVNDLAYGRISRIAPDPIIVTPTELVGDATLLSTRNAEGQFVPAEPHYAVTITIEGPFPDRLKGSLVTTQFLVKSQPLVQTVLHAIRMSLKPL